MSAALAERLRALQRQAGKSRPLASPSPLGEEVARSQPTPQVPENIRRLLGLRTRTLAAVPTPRAYDRHLPGDEIAPGLRYLESRHEPPALPPAIDARFARDFTDVARDDVLCFDTETTGLAGGTGTRAFMIGAADLIDGQLRIRQLLTTTLAAEQAMLETFARWLSPATVLVSYNGRSYDAPLLKARYRLARLPCPVSPLAHLDLLHPARRRWRGRWENCRLATIEHRVLGVVREDDLPGSEAPRAWRDYLAGGPATDLRRVLAHNHTDVRSLAALLAHLSTTPQNPL
ncbi:MAG: ribonuclease H-like domain-containing protein [Arenimonas caeni]|nr:ribonuclease H-like domain-containing protein [Arenimonas caeni]MDY0022105.1 ribonuclease H-like domain-containing protein [Arenimonas caeni]